MKHRLNSLVVCAALALSATGAFAQSPDQQARIGASFMLALGRTPSAGEVQEWSAKGQLPLVELIARHRELLHGDAAAKRALLVRVSQDAFGRDPNADEVAAGLAGNHTYTELMQERMKSLADRPDDYRQVVERAYRRVLSRAPFSIEQDYWKTRAPLSYTLLVGCMENWARRNAPGLMATSGVPTICVNSDYLATLRLSPTLAAEARAVADLPVAGDPNLAAARGQNVIAAGSGGVISVGGIHFIAAGGAAHAGTY